MANLGQEGTPSLVDYFKEGSENVNLRPNLVPTPQGLAMTVAHAARLNIHQNQTETQVIGVPGSTYNQHYDDQIYQSRGGHLIVMGNAPGAETLRLQSKSGAVIEMGHDGTMSIVTGKGLHMGISGDHQIVLQGDYAITTTGAFKVKCGQYIVDCSDYIVHAGGNKIENINGDKNEHVAGDAHHVVQGDHTSMVGGDHRDTVAGNYKSQVIGDRRMHTKGTMESSSTGPMKVETSDEMHHTSVKDMKFGSKANHVVKAAANSTHDTGQNHSITVAQNATYQANGDTAHKTQGNMTHDAGGGMTSTSGQSITQQAQQDHNIVASGSHNINAKTNIAMNTNTLKTSATSALSTSHPSSTQDFQQIASAAQPGAPAQANTDIADPKTEVPDIKDIHKQVGDAVPTDFLLARIDNEASICEAFRSESGSGTSGEIPDKIKSRMKELGMDPDSYYQNTPSPEGGDDQSTNSYNVYEQASTNFVNPLG